MANEELAAALTDPAVAPGNVFQSEAMRKILQMGLFGAGVGVTGRALQGANDFWRRNFGPEPAPPQRRTVIEIPVPVKQAEALPGPASFTQEPLRAVGEHAANLFGLLKQPGAEWSKTRGAFTGWGQQNIQDMPWAIPAAVGLTGAGLYGGYKLTDKLLDWSRSREQESELEAARKRYREALLGLYDQPGKTASAPGENSPLDQLAALVVEKRAVSLGTMGGLALLGLGGVGLASGIGTYNWTRDRSRAKALEEAVRRRREALYAQSPSPVMAVPIPQPMPGGELPEEDPEKVAHIGQAADQVLSKFKTQQQAAWEHWQTLMQGGKKPAPAKPAEPGPPQLPSVVKHAAMAPGR